METAISPAPATVARGRVAQKTILTALLSGAVKYASGQGLGWFVGAVAGGGSSNQDKEILKELAEIKRTLNVILDLDKLILSEIKELAKQLSFDIEAAAIKGAVDGINSIFEDAITLEPGDTSITTAPTPTQFRNTSPPSAAPLSVASPACR